MNKQNSVAILSITALVVTGTLVYSEGIFDSNTSSDLYSEPMGLQGFITMTQADADGNIIRYVQTDNIVPTSGKTCALARIFINPANALANTTGGQGVHSFCKAQNNAYFDTIALGTSAATESATDFGLRGSLIGSAATVNTGSIVNGSGIYAVVQNQFTSTSGTVDEVIIASGTGFSFENNTSYADGTLARKTIVPPVVLTTSDSLTVTWRITAG